jgi:pSer/pThr/pTyr-binding forkhead associated (FHA) protein
MSVLTQYDMALPFVIGGFVLLLLLIVALLFWRKSRRPRIAPQAQSAESGGASSQTVVSPAAPPAAVSLEFTAEAGNISFTLDKPATTIGRAPDNDIVLATPILNVDTVSQHHARLRRDQDGYVVRDLGSKNGLALNGRQSIENLLQDGDRLQFGEVEAIFHQPAGGAA